MKTFMQKYREGGRVSKIAFWVVLVSAVGALALIPVGRQQDFRTGGLSILSDCLNGVMVVGLIVQGFGLRRDRRRPGRTS